MNTPMSEVFDHAAYLVEQGWYQGLNAVDSLGNMVKSDDPNAAKFCAVGALKRAREDMVKDNPTEKFWVHFFETEFHNRLPANLVKIASWNDDPDRKQKDVVELYRKAAEWWREREAE